jgi:hypothetical protein
MKKIHLYNANKDIYVPDADYEEFIGFQGRARSDSDTDIGQYVDTANWTQEFEGKGHIGHVQYAPTRQLLMVTFNNEGGATVCYFRVPNTVYSELKYLSDSDMTFLDARGTPRHVIGLRFWDIIRIRGNQHGSRYNFEYREANAQMSAAADPMKQLALEGEGTRKADDGARKKLSGSALKQYDSLKTDEQKDEFLRTRGLK